MNEYEFALTFTPPGIQDDPRIPPANRLEAPRGKRKDQHSIRINDQWRICFVWSDGNANKVEIVDYHQDTRYEEIT